MTPLFARSDEVLFGALVGGDLSAFDELYQRYERPLFGYLRRELESADAEDVLHETFLSLLKQRKGAKEARSFRAWVFSVARNLCLNRARTSRRAGHATTALGHAPAEPAPTPELAFTEAQQATTLARAVGALPAPAAELYHLRTRGLSYEELAEVLDVPVGTIKSRLHELVRTLREELSS